ncbi:MAG: hypothetical protein WB679_05140 [Terracidiphilus sp.]
MPKARAPLFGIVCSFRFTLTFDEVAQPPEADDFLYRYTVENRKMH